MINRISYHEAKKTEDFFTPGLTEQAGAKSFWYYIAYDEKEKKIEGAAAVDPAADGARLLCIGVSPEREGKGIGSDLLNTLLSDIRQGFEKQGRYDIPPVRFEYCFTEEEWKVPDAFLVRNGFVTREIEVLSSVHISDILKNEILKKAYTHVHKDRIAAVRDIPEHILNAFGNDIRNKGLYPGIHPHRLDKDFSVCYVEEGRIRGCILMSRMADGSLMNEWVYLDKTFADRSVLLYILAESAYELGKKEKKNHPVYFLPVSEAGGQLLRKLFPDAREEYQIRIYDMDLSAENAPALNPESEEQMVCRSCTCSMGHTLECQKYVMKPGSVFYGGDCPHFSEKTDS